MKPSFFKISTLLLIAITIFALANTVLAATATPSATPTPIEATPSASADDIKKSLQERIKKAIEDNLNTSSSSSQVTTTPRLKAFVGKVNSISGNTISITTDHTLKQATITDDTTISRQGNSVKFDTIKIGENIIAMGDTTDNATQTSIRLVLYEQPASIYQTLVVQATIESIDTAKNNIKLQDVKPPFPQELKLSTKAKAFDKELNSLKLTQIEDGTPAILVILVNKEKDTASATQILLKSTPTLITPTPATKAKCGDDICTTSGSSPESPETCPQDCTKP